MPHKKAHLVRDLIKYGAFPTKIITTATEPPADADYERRLRLWACDCAARAIPLLEDRRTDYLNAARAIQAARKFARGEMNETDLSQFHVSPNSKFYEELRATASSVVSEVKLACVLTAQANIWMAARDACQHARQAILNAFYSHNKSHAAHMVVDELDWQVSRLGKRLDVVGPRDWPLGPSSLINDGLL